MEKGQARVSVDVFFFEAFAEEARELQVRLPAGIRAGFAAETIQATGAQSSPPAPLISIRTQSVVPASWAEGLRGVLARTTGYDHLLTLRHALRPPPALACLPEYCTRAVAEAAVLLWMSLLRRLPQQIRQWPTFDRDELTGGECAGRTLLVAGVGRIGFEVARLGRGLGMQVLGVDIVRRHADVEYVSWADGAPRADVAVACMNLTAENRGYFNARSLGLLKAGALFVNVARGELVATADLPGLLESGRLGGVALDVYDDEPQVAEALRSPHAATAAVELLSRLHRDPRVILTPHNAFNTIEAVARKSDLAVRQTASFLSTGRFLWPLEA